MRSMTSMIFQVKSQVASQTNLSQVFFSSGNPSYPEVAPLRFRGRIYISHVTNSKSVSLVGGFKFQIFFMFIPIWGNDPN